MAKCAACGKYLSTKGGAVCSNTTCSNRYHLACLLLPESAQLSSDWLCPDCKRKLPRGDNSATPVKELGSGPSEITKTTSGQAKPAVGVQNECEPSPESQLTLREEIKLFRSELRQVRDELREFRREMADVHASYGACSQRIDGLEAKIEALEKFQSSAVPDSKVGQLEQTVARLQAEINDREQEVLSSDFEIANLPETPGENVINTVMIVAAKLGVKLEDRDLVFAQRVGIRVVREPDGSESRSVETASNRGRRVVVRLARRALRDQLLQAARVRRGATTADLGLPEPPRRFYLNERLTKTNKYLFYRVREAAGRLGWRFTWTKFGRILAKQADGKPTYCIRSEDDLARVFGCTEPTGKKD